MSKKIMLALGGNAIDAGTGIPSAENQQQACEKAVQSISSLVIQGHQLVISHGNGPQVGALLIQNENSHSDKTPAMPLDTLVASTEGSIGFWLQKAMYNEFLSKNVQKKVVSLVSQVVVDPQDPAFTNPTKFVGPFYTEEVANQLAKERNWIVKADSNRGFRRVVPSPKPKNILEADIIKKNMEMGHVVIAVGGGGVPVVQDEKGFIRGVEAVIDKDHASCLLASLIDIDILIILTAVPYVSLHFGKPEQKDLSQVTVGDLKKYVQEGHFPAGSMLPKVEAAITFVESSPHRKAIITSLDCASQAIDGVGTHVIHR